MPNYQNKIVQEKDRLLVQSGGELDIESGGAFKIAGVAVTASADDLNAVAGESSEDLTKTTVTAAKTTASATPGTIRDIYGKITASASVVTSGSSWTAGVFGQLDISAATINAGQTACIWGDYGTTSGTITNASGMRGVAMTNTTAAILNAQDYRYGNATYLLELAGAGGTLNYYAAAGTSAGSAGDAAKCAAQQVISIQVNGSAVYIPCFTQNT
jgi:hypothetical protein